MDFNPEWKTVTLECPPELEAQWRELEAEVPPQEFPWNSALTDYGLRVKIDDRTMFFDSNSVLVPPGIRTGALVTCLIEIKSIYSYKGMSGFSCRVHQMKIHENPGCMFT